MCGCVWCGDNADQNQVKLSEQVFQRFLEIGLQINPFCVAASFKHVILLRGFPRCCGMFLTLFHRILFQLSAIESFGEGMEDIPVSVK
jgi:hypothetical protein